MKVQNSISKYCVIILFLFASNIRAQQKITFPSQDGVTITADLYPVADSLPVILLCHQAGYSRGEYEATALRLNKFGFNCLAIDQRYGDEVNGVVNETAAEAKRLNKPRTNADAEQDIVSAADYLFNKYHKKIMILG